MEDILQFIENLDCEEINELNEEGLLNNNIALQADINGKDIHFELRNDAGEKLEKTIPEDELQKYIVGYEMIRCDGRGMKKERRKCGSCENFTPIEDCAKGNCCNGVQREHNKKLNNGLPILHKVPPKRDYGRYFCIMAEKGETSHGGLTEKLSLFFHAKKQEVNAYGR